MIERKRHTKETQIDLKLNPFGSQNMKISTGQRYFDHCLEQLAFHGGFDLDIQAQGDLDVDDHHMVEDVALCLGGALNEAWSNLKSMTRYGSMTLPMDDVFILGGLDLCGRPHFHYKWSINREFVGGLALEMVPHFFHSLAIAGGFTLHLQQMAGTNHHHLVEAMFKITGRMLAQALAPKSGETSTKGGLWTSQ